MRILVLTPYLPWPLQSGGNAAVFSTLHCLSEDHEFVLLCPIFTDSQYRAAESLATLLPKVRVRAVVCESASGPHKNELFLRSLLRMFARCLRRLFNILAPVRLTEAPIPWNPFLPLPRAFVEAITEELEKCPDLVQCEFAEMMPIGILVPPKISRLFVHHQVHHVYTARFLQVHGSSAYASYFSELLRVQEQTYLRSFDAIITFSDDDRQALAAMVEIDRVHISPYPTPVDLGIVSKVSEHFDGRFFFLGSEVHDPNRDALTWLLDEIWPNIAVALPATELVVIGAWGRRWLRRAGVCKVSFPGFVDNLGAFLRGGIMLVPIRIGSGLRTKTLAAFAQGVPVVSTSVGAEGLMASDGVELIIRDSAAEFTAASIELALDGALRRRITEAGLNLLIARYSATSVRRRRNEIYSSLARTMHAT
jgi:polysaccharide biosynthesis protein PslH